MAEQQRGPHELRRIARGELAHHLGAMAFERARTDAHSQRALLVGTTFADELQDFTLTPGQRTLAGLRGERRARPIGVKLAWAWIDIDVFVEARRDVCGVSACGDASSQWLAVGKLLVATMQRVVASLAKRLV